MNALNRHWRKAQVKTWRMAVAIAYRPVNRMRLDGADAAGSDSGMACFMSVGAAGSPCGTVVYGRPF